MSDFDVFGLGYCPECLTVWTDADTQSSKLAGHCVYCKDSLEIPDIIEGDLAITCDACQGEVMYGAQACKKCGQTYSLEYWRTIGHEVSDPYSDYLNPADDGINPAEIASDLPGKDHLLCCNQAWSDCDCEHSFDWYDNHEPVDKSAIKGFYRESKICEDCAYVRTAQCPMLREWIYDVHYAKQERDSEELELLSYAVTDGCSNFEAYNDVIYLNPSMGSIY